MAVWALPRGDQTSYSFSPILWSERYLIRVPFSIIPVLDAIRGILLGSLWASAPVYSPAELYAAAREGRDGFRFVGEDVVAAKPEPKPVPEPGPREARNALIDAIVRVACAPYRDSLPSLVSEALDAVDVYLATRKES